MRTSKAAFVLSSLAVFALAGCGSGQQANTSVTANDAGQAQASAPVAVAPTGNYHAQLALAGSPTVTADGKDVLVVVSVTNDGATPFGTQATPVHNVNLGAHAVDATGKVVENDLARGTMPEVAPGATVKATILLPVGKVLDHSAELLPVAEGIGWFDQWGTKPLVVGPFEACSNTARGKVCDASGKPLPVAPAQQ